MAEFDKYKATKTFELYSDFSSAFSIHPETKQLNRATDVIAVKRSIRNIILTDKYERPYSDMDGGVRGLLFELNTPQMRSTIKTKIINVLELYEPRCKIVDTHVQVSDDEHDLIVTLYFYVINIQDIQTYSLKVSRIR